MNSGLSFFWNWYLGQKYLFTLRPSTIPTIYRIVCSSENVYIDKDVCELPGQEMFNGFSHILQQNTLTTACLERI
jgi:hypothetical protein